MTADTAIRPAIPVHTSPWPDQAAPGALPTFATCALSGDLQAAGVARHFTRSTLQGWDLGGLIDSVELIVSEMLSNAIRHGLAGTRKRPGTPNLVGLGLLRRGGTVLCAVSDPGAEVPVVREPDELAESGRGLQLIDSLSESWGWTPNHSGKAVWATVSTACG